MIIHLEEPSPVPPYAQVRRQIEAHIHSGVLPPGTRLPSIRQLAAQLNLAANTVARAYRELEQTGVVITRGRNGTLVSTTASTRAHQTELLHAAQQYLAEAAELDRSPQQAWDALETLVTQRLNAARRATGHTTRGTGGNETRQDSDDREVVALQAAVGVHATVEQARGVLAQDNGVDMDAALDLLRATALSEHMPLVHIAREVVARRSRTESIPGQNQPRGPVEPVDRPTQGGHHGPAPSSMSAASPLPGPGHR